MLLLESVGKTIGLRRETPLRNQTLVGQKEKTNWGLKTSICEPEMRRLQKILSKTLFG